MTDVTFKGCKTSTIQLADGLVFGRGDSADVQLEDPAVSRKHVTIVRTQTGRYVVRDCSAGGSQVNGRYFDQHEFVYGDRLQLGSYVFRFTGAALQLVTNTSTAGSVDAIAITRRFRDKITLSGVNLHISPGEFVGILGTSGAGKSTLLDALSGMRKPSSGSVLIDGRDLYHSRFSSAPCGYVPQDDIVHHELTVEKALQFAAEIRLPGNVDIEDVRQLVAHTIRQLALEERALLRVGRLSGGQRKRVSIAAELMSRPAVLFLDEPSSGLDPATENKLMALLRELANVGCTIICTTHVMENVYLMDRLVIVSAGRLIFDGAPDAALEHFAIRRFATLYERLEERTTDEWVRSFEIVTHSAAEGSRARRPGASQVCASSPWYTGILLRRQWELLRAETKNLIMLVGQPLVIGLMVAWMADTSSLKLFLTYLATFWFGCSNAAQEVVKEGAIYRRERLVGMPRLSYLGAKFTFLAGATCVQALLLFTFVHFGTQSLEGSTLWQLQCVVLTALSAVAIGLCISSWVGTTTQAVMVVPLILLPQIVFSGYVLPSLSKGGGAKKIVSELMPSYSSQRLMDVSLLDGVMITPEIIKRHPIAYYNLDPNGTHSKGTEFNENGAGSAAAVRLTLWVAVGSFAAWAGLGNRERS